MKPFLKFFIAVVLFSSLFFTKAEASHIAGQDIYYEYLGNGATDTLKYRVHLILWRECGGIPLGANEVAFAFSPSLQLTDPTHTPIALAMDTATANDPLNGSFYTEVCGGASQTNCTNPNAIYLGYQKFHYAADIVLPARATDWHFRYTTCCRNGAVINVTSGNSCIYAVLNNVAREFNNSAVLSETPLPYVCVNTPTSFLNGPIDPDLDSIVITAMNPGNTQVATPYGCSPSTYLVPYTPLVPLPVTMPGSYTVNPTSGTAVFTPTATGAYVLAFRVEEYDKQSGLKVGELQRDVQLNVLACSVPAPTIGTLNSQIQNLVGAQTLATTPNLTLALCPGETMSFECIGSNPLFLTNTITSTANNAISCVGSSYTVNPVAGGNPVTGTFSWTPPASQIGDHTLIIKFKDSTCTTSPIVLTASLTVTIKVLQGVDIGPDIPFCLGADSIALPAIGPATVSQWTWTEAGTTNPPHGMSNPNVQNPKVAPTRTTTYYLTTDAATACKNIDTVTVYIDTSVSVSATSSDLVLCEPGYVTLDATPTGPSPAYVCGQENLSCTAPSAPYNFGANATSSFNVTPFLGTMAGARIQMLFTPADLAAAGFVGPQLINNVAWEVINKTSQAPFDMEIKMGCTFLTDLTNFVPQPFMKKVYENNSYSSVLGTNSFNLNTPFAWDGTSSVVVEVCFFNATNVGTDEVAASPTTANQYYAQTSPFGGCQIPGAPGLSSPIVSMNRPNTVLTACPLPATAWQYAWDGPFIFDSTQNVTQAFVNSNPSTFVVYTMGGNGCKVGDTVSINLSNHGLSATPLDTTICLDDRVRATAIGIGDAPSATYQWFAGPGGSLADLSCTNCIDPEITPSSSGTTIYTVVRTDFYGCMDTISINITVRPKPTVNITNGDSITLRFGQELQLFSTGATRYIWSPSWAMSNPNVSSPTIKPDENTLYVVSGIDANGCGNYDSIYVNIDYSNNLFVPTAFSPNGDGKNDLFRIANFGFQAMQEFRVFNRWGQEIFSANDNRGWDGTFKGADQDNGTYMYLIRVAFADGQVQTFKGDVMLLR